MNAKDYEKSFNLVSTRSVERIDDILYTGFDSSLADINYSNCIKVYDYLKEFSVLYQAFIRDYQTLEHLDILDNYKMSNYYETPHFNTLRYKNDEFLVYFMRLNNILKLIKESTSNIDDKVNLNIDPTIVVDYLNFGKRYEQLINRFNDIVNIFKNLTLNNDIVISINFDSDDITKLSYVELSFGIYNTNFKLVYLLDNNFTLYSVSNASAYNFSEEEIKKIAQGLYVDKSFLFGIYAFDEDRSRVLRKNTIL